MTSTIYPDSADTTSSGTDQVKTTYDQLGRQVTTTDQNGTVHTFEFDSAGRFYADKVTTLGTNIDGAVRRIERTYDDVGRLQHVISKDGTSSGSTIVNDVLTVYDGWVNVAGSHHDHLGVAAKRSHAHRPGRIPIQPTASLLLANFPAMNILSTQHLFRRNNVSSGHREHRNRYRRNAFWKTR